ncbi:type II secretion system F family protein, partial [Patescibacteria group bacterium]|nr:type II secretion system F family protein [Patescibacteria group bacterium]
LPIFGSLSRKINSARFARNFSSLVESGVAIVKSLEITAGTLSNLYFKESLIASAQQVKKGKELSETLSCYTNLYAPMIIQMTSVGEKTGDLAGILNNLADFYEEEIDNITKNLSSIIEPIIMLVVGAAVGFFAISMIQPMYSMMGGV